ncbi:hypothetical protein [Bacillus atrophaeus]|uniref:hypothetical protein n=1 Tax=Bacillus atrophaeus TaxID=1452 RepID=UPI000D029FCC|nr:hypothetical protein [Bacillus atrophaeus]PRR87415.1 hypothetical protein C6W23_18925 [Bacillus atrophaeus]
MNKLKNIREYFKMHRMISLLVDAMMAIILVSLSILMFGRTPEACFGFFIYLVFSNFIGTNVPIINLDIFSKSGKTKP